jgi:hypothetical protein
LHGMLADALLPRHQVSNLPLHQVEFVQFEHNAKKGFWTPSHQEHRSLGAAVARLHALGYGCFMLAKRDVAPISAEW